MSYNGSMDNPGIISTHSAYSILASSVYGASEVSAPQHKNESTEQKPVEVTSGKDIQDEAIISKEALTMLESNETQDERQSEAELKQQEKSESDAPKEEVSKKK